MKPDEQHLWRLLFIAPGCFPRDANTLGPQMPPRRLAYVLNKWASRGLYEYGVCLDLGWLTDAGREFARRLQTVEFTQ